MTRYFWAFTALVFLCCHGSINSQEAPYTFIREAKSAQAVTYHDYIIIGGGTAGCPLAATLSQSATILVLERGGSPFQNPITNLRNFFTNLANISPKSPAQQFISEDGVLSHRARILCGGSSINAGFWTRAGGDYIERAGWDPKLVEEAYKWAEYVVAYKPELADWQSALRSGLVEAGVLPDNGFSYAELLGTKVGGTIFDEDGDRNTAADFLLEADPAKIDVFLHATVLKILFRYNYGSSKPQAYGVIYKDEKGVLHSAYLNDNSTSEIIISAGALGSPQLLMLSGIGPAEHLRAHGIDVVLDQPMVGQGMADNPINILIVPSPVPVDTSLVQVVGVTKSGNYIEGLSGINIIPSHKDLAHILNETDESFTKLAQEDSSNAVPSKVKVGFVTEKVNGPLSIGFLELENTDPDHNPSVTFNYFQEQEDLEKCVDGMKTLISVVESDAFSKYRYENIPVQALINLVVKTPVNLRPRHFSATVSLKQYCIDTVMSIWHFHGGCQVGRVVDKDYKVLGVDAVRVIDGSTFRGSPGANPQATVTMLGRYMGIMILKSRLNNIN